MKTHLFLGTLAASLLLASAASAITRDEVLVRARAYSVHEWSSTASNQAASCKAAYKSLFPPGDYVGLPYGWGGYMTLFTFDQDIANGYGAGAQETDGVLACIAGVDCSGFVSMAWQTGHYTTSSLDQTSGVIAQADMLPGDVFNQAGYHVAMFTQLLGSGAPSLIEAAGYNTHVNTYGGWSYVAGYIPRRFTNIVGTSATVTNPVGTTANPIVIPSLPYTDARDTSQSLSSVLDGCGAAPATAEKGPEYVYSVNITTPGTLSVSVTNDAGKDMDVELLTHLSTAACTVRNDKSFTSSVGCGTYYVVVDTFNSATNAGNYTLNVSLAPSGVACSAAAGPPAFNPKGKLGDACSYPGHEDLPFCNPNLGSETCIYGSTSSFCSKACAKDVDCGGLGTGGCCQDISGKGEFYCMTKSFCSTSGSSGTSGTSGTGTSGASGKPGSSGGEGSGTAPGDGDQPGPVAVDNSGGCTVTPSRTPLPSWPLVAPLAALALLLSRRRR